MNTTPELTDTKVNVTKQFVFDLDSKSFTGEVESVTTRTTHVYSFVDYGDHQIVLTYNVQVTEYLGTGRWHSEEIRVYKNLRWGISNVAYGRVNPETTGTDDLPSDKVLAKAVKAAKAAVDRYEADEALRPRLVSVLTGCEQWGEPQTVPAEGRVEVGDVAALYSRGKRRFGVVTKVGPKRVEIAYVTRGGLDEEARYPGSKAAITHKAQPIGTVEVVPGVS